MLLSFKPNPVSDEPYTETEHSKQANSKNYFSHGALHTNFLRNLPEAKKDNNLKGGLKNSIK